MNKNKTASSLLLAIGLVMIISLLTLSMLEYIVPFSREIKGVENSSVAYYQANSAIEEGLYDVYTRNNSGTIDDRIEYSTGFTSDLTTKMYNTTSSGNILPFPGEGNSEFNDNWNMISSGNPIQLSVGKGWIDSDFKIAFRVPNLDNSSDPETLSGGILPIINWQLSGISDTLNSSGSIIKAEDILESNNNFSDILDIWNKNGVNLDGNSISFNNFYDNCDEILEKCTLKFSVINKLELDSDNIIIPYLEWKIKSNNAKLPLRYSKINASGKSYGYKKDLEVKVRGNTVNEAFDFTVFQ